jgi:universal stress protein A
MPIRAKRILWPTDFSDLSLHACKYAAAFREQFGSELHVIHVLATPVPFEAGMTVPADIPISAADPELLESSREALTQIAQEQFGSADGIVLDTFFGSAWHGVCEYAREKEIELIIIGTHGRTGIQHVLIGSTAERIVQHAPCPVLTVKHPGLDFVTDEK